MKTKHKYLALAAIFLSVNALRAQQPMLDSAATLIAAASTEADHRAALAAYIAAHPDDGKASVATGTVSKGSISHAKLLPFQGPNFAYYDTISYLDGRAFVHSKVRNTVLAAYEAMAQAQPSRVWGLMECSKPQGGKIWPHRTHQNGMSIDFMVPMSRDSVPYYGLDSLGFQHYLLEFNADGSIDGHDGARIDFEAMAQHLLALQAAAKANGLRIAKVLWMGALLGDLFAGPQGKRLKASGIYMPSGLEPLIDGLHDNHYHVDFAPVGG